MFIIPGHVQTVPNLSLSCLHQHYIGTESHLGRGTLHSPTAIVQITARGQVSEKVSHPVLHDTSIDLLQSMFEQKVILELESGGSEVWGSCARRQSKQ